MKAVVKWRRGTCSACRALDMGRCSLGYATDEIKGQGYGIFSRKRPAEPCPRPITIAEFLQAPKRWEIQSDNLGGKNQALTQKNMRPGENKGVDRN